MKSTLACLFGVIDMSHFSYVCKTEGKMEFPT